MSCNQPSFQQERRFTSEKLHEKHKPFQFQVEKVTEKYKKIKNSRCLYSKAHAIRKLEHAYSRIYFIFRIMYKCLNRATFLPIYVLQNERYIT
jgi:hypothetical protein